MKDLTKKPNYQKLLQEAKDLFISNHQKSLTLLQKIADADILMISDKKELLAVGEACLQLASTFSEAHKKTTFKKSEVVEEDHNFIQAEKYFLKSTDCGCIKAYADLSMFYYFMGKTEKALEAANIGISLGDASCIFNLESIKKGNRAKTGSRDQGTNPGDDNPSNSPESPESKEHTTTKQRL